MQFYCDHMSRLGSIADYYVTQVPCTWCSVQCGALCTLHFYAFSLRMNPFNSLYEFSSSWSMTRVAASDAAGGPLRLRHHVPHALRLPEGAAAVQGLGLCHLVTSRPWRLPFGLRSPRGRLLHHRCKWANRRSDSTGRWTAVAQTALEHVPSPWPHCWPKLCVQREAWGAGSGLSGLRTAQRREATAEGSGRGSGGCARTW
jgi:hypothetical protein